MTAEGTDLGEVLSSSQMTELRQAFNETANGSDTISSENLGEALQRCGEEIPNYKLRQISEDLQKETGGNNIDFIQFVQLFKDLSLKTIGGSYKKAIDKRKGVEQVGVSSASAEGTKHSFSTDEMVAFTDWINSCLEDDPDLADKYLPIDEQSSEGLFKALKDGVLLCKLINFSMSGTIDERAINKTKLNVYTIHENQTLALNSAMAIGCNIVNIGAEDLIECKPHLALGILWQVIRIGLFAKVTIQNCPGLVRLLEEEETLEFLRRMSPEEVLLRWFNYHLEEAGHSRRVTNFSKDISDSENYSVLLNRIAPISLGIGTPHIYESDPTKLACLVLENAKKMGCKKFVRPKDIIQGNPKLNLAFVCNLFNKYPGLEPMEEEIPEIEETREEKTFRNWMNSLGVKPYVYNLFADIDDGIILIQLFEQVRPGIADWTKVNTPPFKKLNAKMKKIENCNYAIQLAEQLKFSLVGIGGTDIIDGNSKLVMSLLWQTMRAYTMTILQKCADADKPISDTEIVAWVNEKLATAGKSTQITGFKDAEIKTSRCIVDLIDAIKPGIINYSMVSESNDDDELIMNAKYAISMARKLGARVYALPEDLVEVKSKMVLTAFACLMAQALVSKTA